MKDENVDNFELKNPQYRYNRCNNEYLGQGSDVGTADDVVVKVLQEKVPDEWAPDGDVVEDGPVGRVQCDLHRHHDHQHRGHHRTDQIVIRRRLALQRSTVKVRTCKKKPKFYQNLTSKLKQMTNFELETLNNQKNWLILNSENLE